jgi:AsmA protein
MDRPGARRWPWVLGIAAAVLAVLLVVGVLSLDRVLLRVAREQAADYSRKLGRPVAVEGVATQLWGGLGVKVSGLSVGAGPGEGVPLLELPRAEVNVGLLRTLLSRGRVLRIDRAVVHGLHVNVVRLPDGTTNVERLSRALSGPGQAPAPPRAPPSAAPAPPGEAAAQRSLEIGRAAVEDARLALRDLATAGSRELAVDHLDVEVRDLAPGRPLELVLKAAVLAERQNLELRLKSAALPPGLVPTPEEVTLKVEPVDLAPLAPFLPKGVGLLGGRFQADLQAALGAAAPGGHGPTRLRGGFQLSDLAFAAQQGGKKLDASLDADLDADAVAGDLSIQKLLLRVGPGSLEGHGRASGLRGDSPRVEGLELVAHDLDPAAFLALWPPLSRQLGGVVVAGPVGLTLRGGGTAAAQRVDLTVDLGPVRLEVPHQLEKAAGGPLQIVAGATADQGGGRVRFEASADLAGLDLRPGGTLAKKPGDPLTVKAAGSYRRAGQELQVALSELAVNLLGDPLAGKGQVTLAGEGRARTTRFDAELSGGRLDLDRLLLPASSEKKATKPPEKPAAAQPGDAGAMAGLAGEARLRLGTLVVKKAEARNVAARLTVRDDQVTLEQAHLEAFGGSVDAAGTSVHLVRPDGPFKAEVHLKGVSAEQALALLSPKRAVSGTLDADLQLAGAGMERARVEKTATGTLQGHLRNGTFHGKDLFGSVAGSLADKLPFAKRLAASGDTSLGPDLAFSFHIADGVARLDRPVHVDGPQGRVELSGGVGLDGTLDMPATVALSPDAVAKLSGGKVKPAAPIPLGFKLVGAASSPRIEGLSVDAAARSIATDAAKGAVSGQAKRLESTVKDKLKGLFGK